MEREYDAELAGSCRVHLNPDPLVSKNFAWPAVFPRKASQQSIPNIARSSKSSGHPTTADFCPSRSYHRNVHEQCLIQLDDASEPPYGSPLDNRVFCSATVGEPMAQLGSSISTPDDPVGRAISDESSPAPETQARDKKLLTSLPLLASLTRSFDSSEMDKITKAVVRVNGFGLSLSPHGASEQGNVAALAQEPCGGRGVGSSKKISPRVLPSVGAFTVQCAKCFKWRIVPSKEQYEKIRQHIIEKPFFCSSTSAWQPGASCDDPPVLLEDKNFVWAIDKPSIPVAPTGWERLLVIRSEGCSKFADIYYVAPSGKKLRSMPDIERYLSEHPELVDAGVSLNQFSFVIPSALDETYCRKKTVGSSAVMRGSITHKNTPVYNLGVRSQPLKVSHVRKLPIERFDHRNLTAGSFDFRQPETGQSSVNCPENAHLVVEPLSAWDADNHAMTIACHAGGELGSLANPGLQ